MAAPNVANIFKGNAVIYFAPAGTAKPDGATIATGTIPAPWERVGYTKEPLAVSKEYETTEIEVEEELNAVDEFIIKTTETWETTLAELTPEYLALVFNGTQVDVPAGVGTIGYSEVTDNCGGECQRLTDYAVIFEGQRCDNDHYIRRYLPAANLTLNGELTFSKKDDDYTGIPLQVKLTGDECPCWQIQTADPLP